MSKHRSPFSTSNHVLTMSRVEADDLAAFGDETSDFRSGEA